MELTKAFYSPTEVARLLGLKTSGPVLRRIHAGTLAAIRLTTRTYRIPQRAVARLLGEPVSAPRGIEAPHGGPAAAARIRARVSAVESRP